MVASKVHFTNLAGKIRLAKMYGRIVGCSS
jgi:hypothetical protein